MMFFQQAMSLKSKLNRKKLKKPQKWLPPINLERQYDRLLRQLVKKLISEVKRGLIPELSSIFKETKSSYKDSKRSDDMLDILTAIIRFIKENLSSQIQLTIAEMEEIAREVSNFNENQFQKVNNSVFGIDIFIDQPFLKEQLELFSRQNVQLIKSIPEDSLDQMTADIERGLQEGKSFKDVSKEIQKRFDISKKRAKLIARDQITKLNSNLTRLRQESAGIKQYIWQTSGDERVRATHKANNGKKFSWDKPPEKTGHPGTDINCRCVAIPVMEGMLD